MSMHRPRFKLKSIVLAAILAAGWDACPGQVDPSMGCANLNGDETVNLSDPVYLLSHLFRGGPPPDCGGSCGNVNGDESLNISDAVYLLNWLFLGGPAPVCPGPEPMEPPPGMIAWWPGDGDARDLTGDHHGTVAGGATFAQGKVGASFSLDGIDDYVAMGTTAELHDSPPGFTWDAWVSVSQINDGYVLFAGDNVGCEDYQVGIGRVHFLSQDLDELWGTADPIGGCGVRDAVHAPVPGGIELGSWYHVALVADYSSEVQQLFLNGQQVASSALTGEKITRPMQVTLGACCLDNGQVGPQTFGGLIDEVHVFNRPLSAGEIASIFDAGSAGLAKRAR